MKRGVLAEASFGIQIDLASRIIGHLFAAGLTFAFGIFCQQFANYAGISQPDGQLEWGVPLIAFRIQICTMDHEGVEEAEAFPVVAQVNMGVTSHILRFTALIII